MARRAHKARDIILCGQQWDDICLDEHLISKLAGLSDSRSKSELFA